MSQNGGNGGEQSGDANMMALANSAFEPNDIFGGYGPNPYALGATPPPPGRNEMLFVMETF